jgi:hypothetical protein
LYFEFFLQDAEESWQLILFCLYLLSAYGMMLKCIASSTDLPYTPMAFLNKYFFPWLSFFLLISTILLYLASLGLRPEVFPEDLSLLSLSGGTMQSQGDRVQCLFDAGVERLGLSIPYPEVLQDQKRLRLTLAGFENVTAITLGYPESQKVRERVYTPLIDPGQKIFRFGLQPSPADQLVLHFKRASPAQPASVTVQELAFESRGFFGSSTFFSLAFVSFAGLLSCIALFFLALLRPWIPLTPNQRLALFPLALVLGLFFCSVWLMVVHQLKAGPLALSAGLLLLLVASLRHRQVRRSLVLLARQMCKPLLAYYLLILALSILIATRHDAPLYDISWISIAYQKTYHAFTAHDNLFQYLNALALGTAQPFASLYQAPHLPYLFYGVEHRGILPGFLLAPLLFLLGHQGELAGGNFALFLIFGTALTATTIFPLYALWRRYRQDISPYWVFFLLSANGYVMVNYYYTWFKLLSGGLVLAGLYLLLSSSRKLSHWLLAGLCWGAATGMHAGAILALPALGLFVWLRGIFLHGKGLHPVLLAPGLLVLIFVASNLPWALVKAQYFPDDNSLVKEHFLNGHNNPDGLLASAQDFMQAEPWASQWAFRTQRLKESLRWPLVEKMLRNWSDNSLRKNFSLWLRFEFTFVAILLYPPLLLALSACILPGTSRLRRSKELSALLGLAACALIGNIFIYFNKIHIPDLTWHLPAATLLLLYLGLFTVATGKGRAAAGLTVLFSLVGSWRFIRLL